ncbi:MAG: glycoside hydrolase family 28 protein [Pseudobutyrivibrio sp.]|nr:glycoside hydrolase family 28 protein [Pseudobutyrivibrio sp.]
MDAKNLAVYEENTRKARQNLNNNILRMLYVSGRSVTFEICDGGIYNSVNSYVLYVNGRAIKTTDKVVNSVFSLAPQENYVLHICKEGSEEITDAIEFRTTAETVTLDVRDFGAMGDGRHNDTVMIQAAIMSCPKGGRVFVPEGKYRITNLFLKSDLILELDDNAELISIPDKDIFPRFPSVVSTTDQKGEYHLGSWEGNPLPMFCGIISGVNVENVLICGRGTINGNASKETWWKDPKIMNVAFRPRLLFLNNCKNITLQGITVTNSPSWTLHPFFSEHLRFYNLTIQNPPDSPNTDGFDPESCKDIVIAGVKFSLGDDCIAVKSGKIYMGSTYKTPSEDITIRQCLMENGHGAVTLGSEMAGGVKNLTVRDCIFRNTDRGLRIKTRRGRGKDAVIDGITFENIRMDNVMTPFVINCFYFCDPDGKTNYVQSRDFYPVDEGTPSIKKLVFKNIESYNCHVAASFFEGLPEQKIESVVMENVTIDFSNNPKCDVPAMSNGVEVCSKKGIFARNISELVLKNVSVKGQEGQAFIIEDVDRFIN